MKYYTKIFNEIEQAKCRFIFSLQFLLWIGICAKDCEWLKDTKDTKSAC